MYSSDDGRENCIERGNRLEGSRTARRHEYYWKLVREVDIARR
jgi:hypothetical protein